MRDTIGRKPFHSSKGIKKKRDSQKFPFTVWSEEYGIMGSAYYKNATQRASGIQIKIINKMVSTSN